MENILHVTHSETIALGQHSLGKWGYYAPHPTSLLPAGKWRFRYLDITTWT